MLPVSVASGGATGDGLHVFHAAHDVAQVGRRFAGQGIITGIR